MKTKRPQDRKAVRIRCDGVKRHSEDYCDTIDRSDSTSQNTLYEQYKERYPDMSDEQIMSLVRECQMYAE